jgi:prepilin-type N-terminal cleavage/methylation domain-containing protein
MLINLRKKMKDRRGFNMIELMVVVVIIGILAAIAVPIYSKYAKNSRVTEATGRLGDILTAAKSYAIENEANNTPTDANWPASCAATNFVGDCTASQNFTYALTGAANGALTITATGRASTPMTGVTVTLTITDPTQNGAIAITGL